MKRTAIKAKLNEHRMEIHSTQFTAFARRNAPGAKILTARAARRRMQQRRR